MDDNKYIVFKREDWDAFVENYSLKSETEKRRWGTEAALYDAVVMRTRDAFASAALHTYANSISIAARAIGELVPSTRDRLQRIADYFHGRAIEADDTNTKLPD